MKAILEFQLPDDECEFRVAVNSKNCWFVVFEMYGILRDKKKYDVDPKSRELAEDLLQQLCDLMDYNNVGLDDLP